MPDLPHGVVTFLFTDVEGSTRLWQDAPDVMAQALHLHDDVVENAALSNNGVHIGARGEGDSHFVVFSVASDAVAAATAIQSQLAEISWDTPRPIKVRASIHTGMVDLQLGQYYGTPVNRAARLRGIAHGGQTLISASTWELVKDTLPDGVTVVDHGEHRLRDLTSPEHVFELVIDGLEHDFPPLVSLDATRNNLPIQLTDFIGRPEVEEIKRLVREARLVTVLAPGGVGKTRSAIQASAELVSEFPDGVFFIDLAPIDSHRDIAQTAAESLGIALTGNDDLETQLLAHLVNERHLLIFDNFEHVIEGASLLARILTAAPGVRILVTSRVKLGISGETVINLPGLIVDWNTPDEAFEASGVRLFIDAAKRADALFSLEADDLEPLSRILRLVGGTPLGIILSASWVDTLPVSEIADEIEKSMDFLEAGQTDQPDRHRSMRAVFEYSWQLLDGEERRTFAGLSVFRGGFTREAAEAVAGASVRHLSNLVAKSLIGFDRGSNRYAVHELLRQYAEAELAADSARLDATAAEHARYFADRAGIAAQKLTSGGEQHVGIRIVEEDIDNMRLALRHACKSADPDRARAFSLAFGLVYEINGWIKAAAELFAEIRETFKDSEKEGAVVTRALAATIEAKFLTNLGQVASAAPMAESAVRTLRTTSDTLACIIALEALSEVMTYRGDADRVLELSLEARRLGDESGDALLSAGMRNYAGGAYLNQGDVESALKELREGEQILVEGGEQMMLGWNLQLQASVALMQGRLDDAAFLHSRQVDIARDLGHRRVLAVGLTGLGQIQIQRGEWGAADRTLCESLDLFERMGLATEIGYVTVLLAKVIANSGDTQRAAEAASCVRGDPSSDRPYLFQTTTTAESAAELLDELSAMMEPDAFASAVARGEVKGLDVLVKELLTEGRTYLTASP
ncbi:MAG TPA: adenylate/guanylate cyclase domain-containing protein [Acidimicrobiia bacterium]|nr:adenylate/guanylate cyclase domain-containing protein [Acidimicrobiia bacterium]